MKPDRYRLLRSLGLLSILTILLYSFLLPGPIPGRASAPAQNHLAFLPVVVGVVNDDDGGDDTGYVGPFGVEVWDSSLAAAPGFVQQAQELGVSWIRLGSVKWHAIQPNEGDPYDWSVLGTLEAELVAAGDAGLTPMVTVHHSPRWATIGDTDCGAIRADKFSAFADFMSAVVTRYKEPPFNVHYWELGNEPDVDPSLVPTDSVFGCWGDIDDPYYGGRHYGEMLKVVSPAIKAADPDAKVIIGGLLLNTPSPTPEQGSPQRFLEGMLVAGAAPHLDIVAYHGYPSYWGRLRDFDLTNAAWASWGGLALGRARFLREVMASFDISKPLLMNETALGCPETSGACDPPPAEFFQAQADYIARTFPRGLSEDISGFGWFTLNATAWRYTGLLDRDGVPLPAYWAYHQLALQLNRSTYEGTVDYGADVEAYSFVREEDRVHVVWSLDFEADTISVPQSDFLAAYDRDGTALSPVAADAYYQFTVGFSPIYVVLRN